MSRIQRVGTQMLLLLYATAAWPQLGSGQGARPVIVAEARKKLALARVSWSTAQSHQKAGEFASAISGYSQAIETLSAFTADPESKAVLADAHFGRASSLQQDTRSDSAPNSPVLARDSTALSDYRESSTLDSARFFSAANNNAGMLLHDTGKHREALARFLAATRSPHPARGAFFVHAADEYLELNLPDSAAQTYRAALTDDSTLVAARAGLLRAFTARPVADSLLRVASKWSSNSLHAQQIMDAMYTVLINGRWHRGGAQPSPVADSCFELLALNFAAMGLGPPDVAREHMTRLQKVASSEQSTKSGVDALLAAYANTPRADRRTSAGDLPGAEWWSQSQGRHAVWSTVLGGIGRWHDARGADSTAMAYYEAALGIPWRYNEPPEWIDIELVFPLAVLYSDDAAQRASPERLNKFLDGVFMSKLLAYQQRDLPRIRRFHTSLGAFFASRDEWRGAPRGAIYQLESMRNATKQLNQGARDGEVLRDAPELLRQLVIGYCKAGAMEKATQLAGEIAEENRRLGRTVDRGAVCGSRGQRS